jgi:hypothetical protein
LESHWNGTLLTDFVTVCEWTKTMRWDGNTPNVYRLEKTYELGIKLNTQEIEGYNKRLIRTPKIERWSLLIKTKKIAG